MMKKYGNQILLIVLCFILSGCGEEKIIAKESYRINRTDFVNVTGLLEMKITEESMEKTVEPKHPSGYYHYYEEKEGYLYYVAKGTIQNNSKHSLFTPSLTTNVYIGEKKYAGRMALSDSDGKEFYEEIKQGGTLPFVLFYLIPEEQKAKADTVELLFQKEWARSKDAKNYDYQYLVSLSK